MAELALSPVFSQEGRQHLLGMFQRATHTDVRGFPGTMPVTLSRRHLKMIKDNDYVLLEKSDGTRYLLFTTSEGAYLVDRRMQFYCIEPNPQINDPRDNTPQVHTLVDGELVYNLVTEMWEYLIYDTIAINGDFEIAGRNYRERMAAAENWVAAPRVYSVSSTGVLRIRIKDFYEVGDIRDLFNHVRKDDKGHFVYMNHDRRDGVVCNENDGCIFAPAKLPYPVKTCNALLKWKPPTLNSVDFLLQLQRKVDHRGRESVISSILYKDGRGNSKLRDVRFPSAQRKMFLKEFNKYNNSIVELTYDRLAGEWKYIRMRADKNSPNYAGTVIDTLESISENMDREELVKFFQGSNQVGEDGRPTKKRRVDRDALTFRDDLFDDENPDYVQATPMSLIPPPFVPPETIRGPRRNQVHVQKSEQEVGPDQAKAANPYAVEI